MPRIEPNQLDNRSQMSLDFVGPFAPERVSCHVSGKFEFPPHVSEHRDRIWQRHKRRWPRDFDGPLLRLSHTAVSGGSVYLECTRTGYADYIASRDPYFGEGFPGVERADPIGMTILVVSSDRRLLVSQRSEYAEQNPAALYFVGGYAEPPPTDRPVDLFAEALRELREETGIVDIDPVASRILGASYDPAFCHPELFFVVRATVRGEVLLAKVERAADAAEAQAFHLMPVEHLYRVPDPTIAMSWNYRIGCALLRRMPQLVSV